MKITKDMYGPWRSGDEKPTRPGVYERMYPSDELGYSYFDGNYWMMGAAEIDLAYIFSHRPVVYGAQSLHWRGLNADYSKGAK